MSDASSSEEQSVAWSAELLAAARVLRADFPQLAYWVALAADHLPKLTAERDRYKQLAEGKQS
jgi:hypothetical protein